MVAMSVRYDDSVEPRQIDSEGLDVAFESVGVIAGVEKDAPSAVLNKSSEAPILDERG